MDADKSLRRIAGIGPAREARFKELGITDLDELASADAADLAGVDEEAALFSHAQLAEWIDKAKRLTAAGSDTRFPETPHSFDDARRLATETRESFVLTIAFDENRRVADTAVTHVRSQANDRWRGWSTERLRSFIERSAGSDLDPEVNESTAGRAGKPARVGIRQPQAALSHTDLVIGGGTHTFEYVVEAPHGKDAERSSEYAYTAAVTIREVGFEELRQVTYTEGRHSVSEQLVVPVGELALPPGVYELELTVTTLPGDIASSDIRLRRHELQPA